MEGHKGGRERDFQRKILSMKKRMPSGVKWIWENKSSRRWSPGAISQLTSVADAEETHVDARNNGKG